MEPDVARKRWQATQESGTPGVVGSFYVEVLRKMTGANWASNPDEGDLILWLENGSAVGLEVKGGNSQHSFRVNEQQFERNQRRSEGFPFEGNFLYCLFSYDTHESRPEARAKGRTRQSLVRREILKGRGPEFLIKRTRHLWILPLQFLEGYRQFHPHSRAPLIEADGIKVERERLKYYASQVVSVKNGAWGVKHGHADFLPPRRRTRRITFGVTLFHYPGMPEIPLRGVTWK